MRRIAIAISTMAFLSTTTALAHDIKGCNTRHCDVKWERHWLRKHPPRRTLIGPVTASWFNDAGATASGSHYALGVAHKTLAFGTRLRMCASRCATVTVEDRGPFIAGREFDLNYNAKTALGCSDLCSVRYRIIE